MRSTCKTHMQTAEVHKVQPVCAKIMSPIYRNCSYAEGKGNAKRAGIGRDGT